jgi:hypothetical protein
MKFSHPAVINYLRQATVREIVSVRLGGDHFCLNAAFQSG